MEPPSELRKLDEEGNIVIEKFAGDPLPTDDLPPINEHGYATTSAVSPELPVLNLYYLGVSRRFITQGAKNIGIEINYCDNVDDADVILTDKKMYKKRPKSIRDAEGSGIPLYMIREDTRVQVENCLLNVLQNQLQTP